MDKDVLVILMMAFGLFAILMFILFYIYVKKSYNIKHLDENYIDEDELCELIDIMLNDKVMTFDANDYQLSDGDKVTVLLDNKKIDGIVKKENYQKSIHNIHETPRLLILCHEIKENLHEDEKTSELYKDSNESILKDSISDEVNSSNIIDAYDEGDFIPKKKI